MVTPSVEDIRGLFPKVKKLLIPSDLDIIDWENLLFFSWVDPAQEVMYLITDITGGLIGVRSEVTRHTSGSLKLGHCDVCKTQRERSEILMISTRDRRVKHYRTVSKYICEDYIKCNNNLLLLSSVESLIAIVKLANAT